jgi:hypothetical protein
MSKLVAAFLEYSGKKKPQISVFNTLKMQIAAQWSFYAIQSRLKSSGGPLCP